MRQDESEGSTVSDGTFKIEDPPPRRTVKYGRRVRFLLDHPNVWVNLGIVKSSSSGTDLKKKGFEAVTRIVDDQIVLYGRYTPKS